MWWCSEKSIGPRTYRTRKDPFEAAWDEVCQWLVVQHERTGRSVFDELQQRYPGQYPDTQIRTLQRHIQLWRARTVLTFADEDWLDEVVGRQNVSCSGGALVNVVQPV